MSALGSPSPLFLASAAAADTAANITKSVRFNSGDSAYLNRTPSSAGNRKTWTVSFWVKICKSAGYIYLMNCENTNRFYLLYQSGYITLFNTSGVKLSPDRIFRDHSAWYHMVIAFDTTQSTSSNRLKWYINGEEISDYRTNNTTYPSQNDQTEWNTATAHEIGSRNGGSFGGIDYYLTDFYFIDGSQKVATDFGAFDDNGVWQAAAYSGTYGTNGFHLFDFANESTVGHDSSENENDFTANNISSSAGVGNDVLFDVPTNGTQSDTGAGGEVSGNYCTLNPIARGNYTNATFSNGNLDASFTSNKMVISTIAVSSGKWYYEEHITSVPSSTASTLVRGFENFTVNNTSFSWRANGGTQGLTGSPTLSTYTNGDVLGIAVDVDNTQVTFYKNGTQQGTGAYTYSTFGSNFLLFGAYSAGTATISFNFGQRAFAHSAPSGFKALCTTNLPTPTIANGRDHFDIALYTGNGGSSTITVSGLNFGPNLVWLKGRSDPDKHGLYDTVRGATKLLIPSSANGESTQNGVTAFNSDGFDIGNYAETNGSSRTYVAWAWNVPGSASSNSDGTITSSVTKNADAGISIVTWTGDDSTGTIGHGLGSKPDLIIAKVYGDSNYSDNWPVYSSAFDGTHYAYLNDSRAFTDFAGFWNDGTATSTVFPVGDYNTDDTKSLIAYCFTSVAGFSQFGTYSGNSDASNGNFVYLPFRPAFLLIKDTTSTGYWYLTDSTRNPTNDGTTNYVWTNTDAAEQSDYIVDLLSNGFRLLASSGNLNASGRNYIYMAFAENPFQANGGLAR